MNQVLLLSSVEHRHNGWKPPVAFQFAAGYSMVPAGLPELPALLPVYPLGFFRAALTVPWQLVALTGFRPGQNLYVAPDGRWAAPYVPKSVFSYPFVLQLGQAAKFSVGFIKASDAWREKPDVQQGEQCFFDSEGKQSAALAEMVQRLNEGLKGQQLALRAIQALEAHGLLEPWPGAQPSAQAGQSVDADIGLFGLNEGKLKALDGPALMALQEANALPLAYAHLFSLSRLDVLRRLAAQRERDAQERLQATSPPELGLVQKLFDPTQPDTIKFNW